VDKNTIAKNYRKTCSKLTGDVPRHGPNVGLGSYTSEICLKPLFEHFNQNIYYLTLTTPSLPLSN